MKHFKIPGYVTAIDGRRWWARLVIEGRDYEAEMVQPLPDHAQEGSIFSIHQPKRGKPYLYWITGPKLTKRQVKKARQRARELIEVLQWGEA